MRRAPSAVVLLEEAQHVGPHLLLGLLAHNHVKVAARRACVGVHVCPCVWVRVWCVWVGVRVRACMRMCVRVEVPPEALLLVINASEQVRRRLIRQSAAVTAAGTMCFKRGHAIRRRPHP